MPKCCLSDDLNVNNEVEELIIYGMEFHNLAPFERIEKCDLYLLYLVILYESISCRLRMCSSEIKFSFRLIINRNIK